MPILISGSIAYDYIMDFPDSFRNHILPEQAHILSVSFVIPELKKEFGGTGGNIAYTMRLLGGDPILLGALGNDGTEYIEYFEKQGIGTRYITRSLDRITASAYITTDKEDNQISAFYVGPGHEALQLNVADVKETLELAIISANNKEVMIQHAKQCNEANIPLVFDPGQHLTAFSAQELMLLIGQSNFLIANDYEMKLITEKTGWGAEDLLQHVNVLITTHGEKGSVIRTKDELFEAKPCPPTSVEDPTGAGDAYRAGFFTAYTKGLGLQTCGQVGSVAATYAVEHYGTQNHRFTLTEFKKRYEDTYKKSITL